MIEEGNEMKYVIIGGDAAGMSAALQIINLDKHAEVTILEKGGIYSYGQCGLPYVISGDIASTEKLVVRSAETYREKFGMNALTFHEVTKVDNIEKIVSGKHVQTGEPFQFSYDKLLIASGASPIVPNWPGMELEHVHVIKTIPDAEKILASLEDDIHDVTVVGGGYIGLEMAESFKKLGLNVRIINRGSYIGKIFDSDMATMIEEEAKKHGIKVFNDETTEAIIGTEKVEAVKTDKATYETDLVLIAIGIYPNTNFLKNGNVQLDDRGAIIVDEHMQTSDPAIFAAGDCALHYHLVKDTYDYIPLGTTANKQGRIAGMNMAGKSRSFKGITGTSIIKFMDLSLGKTGLSEREAEQLRIPYDAVTVRASDIAHYYPGATPLVMKLIFNKETKEVLGAQIVGIKGVDKRIDVLAVALYNKMNLQDLEDLDLAYAPPYNGVWDPIQRAARTAERKT